MLLVHKYCQLRCWIREFSQKIFDHLRYRWILEFADRFDLKNEKRQVLTNELARSTQMGSFDESNRANRICHWNAWSIKLLNPMIEWRFSTDIEQCQFEPATKTSALTIVQTHVYRDERRPGRFICHADFHNHWWPVDRCLKDARHDTIVGTGTQSI